MMVSNMSNSFRRVGQWMKVFLQCKRGVTAVEFAILAPVFLMITLSVFEVGRAMLIRGMLQYSVEEAGRFAMANPTASTTTVEAKAVASAPISLLTTDNFTVTSAVSGTITFVTIDGTFTFSVLVPIVPISDINFTAKSRVPVSL
jgi:Flp pilus assembly protein TadG